MTMTTKWMMVMGMAAAALHAEEAPVRLVLPLERTAYFVGETVPLAVAGVAGAVKLALVDEGDAALPLYAGPAAPVLLDTARLAAGTYRVRVNETVLSPELTLTDPLREAPVGVPDETRVRSTPELRQALRETGVNAVMWTAFTEDARGAAGPRLPVIDDLTPSGAMIFLNPTTRPSSFFPARGGRDELEGMRHRYALYAQANARYPSFGGFWYDWDAAGIFGIHGLMLYYHMGALEEGFRAFSKRRDDAVYDEFRRRTGLEPVTPMEFMQYCLSAGRTEFAYNVDYVTFRLQRALAEHTPKMTAEEKQAFERRLFAWNAYAMSVYAEAYAGHQAFLREIMPSLRNTSSQNIDHNTVRGGHWHPESNAALDFRYMSAWNDQIGHPDYPDQWLITAGVLDIGRRVGQPVWIASTMAMGHALSPYPGKFQRMAGHILGYGGAGLGNAGEGFTTILGSMDSRTAWPNLKNDDAGLNDLIGGRDFLKRFAALAQQCGDYRRVAVLYSQRQFGIQENNAQFGTPAFQTFTTLAHLGYHPRFVTEVMIDQGALNEYRALVIANQVAPLPETTVEAIRAFTGNEGRVFIDRQSEITLEAATPMEVSIPFSYPGVPHNWAVINAVSETAHDMHLARTAALKPGFHAALGDSLRTPLMSAAGQNAKVSTFALDGGEDATYVVAVNDAPAENHMRWARHAERLVANGAEGVLYDLTAEEFLGPLAPMEAVFENLAARVYGVLARPAAKFDVKATQRMQGGERLRVAVAFLDAEGQPLKAALPFHVAVVQPNGTEAAAFYRATGRDGVGAFAWTMPANAADGAWSVRVRSQLDGMTVHLPVQVKGTPGRIAAAPLTDPVVVRGREKIEALLARKPALVIPVFDGPSYAERLAAARTARAVLEKRGIAAEIREKPATNTYYLAYDPTPEQAAENARARRGEAIGSIKQLTQGYVTDYEAAVGGYIFGKPTLLIDLAGQRDEKGRPVSGNPMVARLDWLGALWPRVSADFPGHGKAVVQMVSSAFAYDVDSLVIQASDPAGLEAGARALAALPVDWADTSVARARTTLLDQFGIGEAPTDEEVSRKGLTANGTRVETAPRPLALVFGKARPPTLDQVEKPAPVARPARAIPGSFKPQDFVAHYLLDGAFVETVHSLPGDCRFFDGLLLKAEAKDAGPYTITLEGVFRYNDRAPRGQGSWDSVMAAWNAIPKVREAMAVDIYVNGKPAGSLTETKAEQRTVSLYQGSDRKADEEAVVRIAGKIDLPAGTHDLMLVPRNMVDGLIATVGIER